MNQADTQRRALEFSQALDIPIVSLSFIRDNKYCTIYEGQTEGGRVIVKQYKGDDTDLAENEGKACDFYHQRAKDNPCIVDGRTLRFNREHNLLCLEFVEGERLSDIVNRSRWSPVARGLALNAMSVLGRFVRDVYEASVQGEQTLDPFYFEYLAYCSRNLETVPVVGQTVFQDASKSASRMQRELLEVRVKPSFAHRDLVFQNIHVTREKVGLIDFANASFRGHVLDDYYCLYTALNAMVLAPSLKKELWEAFASAVSIPAFSKIEHEFFSAFHKRRWLWITPRAKGPTAWLRLLMPDILGASKLS